MEKLKEKWKTFLEALFDPWSLVLLFITITMLVLAFTQVESNLSASSRILFTVFPIVISLSSAILGSRVAKQWSDMTEERMLVARGNFAIRSLKLLFTNLANLENRIKTYLYRQNNGKKPSAEVLNVYYEEISEKCKMIQEEIINSIEDWTDVIPEANLRSHIEVLNDLKLALLISEKEVERFNNELVKTKGQSKKEIQELKSKMEEQEKVIFQLREKLLERKQIMDNSILSGISTSILAGGANFFENAYPDPNPVLSSPSLIRVGSQEHSFTDLAKLEKPKDNKKVNVI
jgi:hypothetical protein